MYTPETLLLSLGIRTSYKGYAFLVTVLEQALEDEKMCIRDSMNSLLQHPQKPVGESPCHHHRKQKQKV